MNTPLSKLQQQALALAILFAVISVPAAIVAPPLFAWWHDTNEQSAVQQRLLASYIASVRDRLVIEARVKLLEQKNQQLVGILEGASSDLAGAALQAEISRLVSAAGGELHAALPGKAEADRGFEKISSQVDLSLAETALPQLLSALEAHTPFLFADDVRIEAPPERLRSPMLSIHMIVYGYRRVG